MMKRVELSDNMMELVNGGTYKIYDLNTGELLGACICAMDCKEVMDALNKRKVAYRVELTSVWDDDFWLAGTYYPDGE